MLSCVVASLLCLAGSSSAQNAPKKIAEVTTPDELQKALTFPETVHIIIKKHLDLTSLPPDNTNQPDATEAVFYIPPNIQSIRVRLAMDTILDWYAVIFSPARLSMGVNSFLFCDHEMLPAVASIVVVDHSVCEVNPRFFVVPKCQPAKSFIICVQIISSLQSPKRDPGPENPTTRAGEFALNDLHVHFLADEKV
jgi:hypothetical protein